MKNFSDDVPRHKKKSKRRGLPRAKHKHKNTLVWLESYDKDYLVKQGDSNYIRGSRVKHLAEVCIACGRINNVYFIPEFEGVKIPKDDESLPVWECDTIWDKFARPQGFSMSS